MRRMPSGAHEREHIPLLLRGSHPCKVPMVKGRVGFGIRWLPRFGVRIEIALEVGLRARRGCATETVDLGGFAFDQRTNRVVCTRKRQIAGLRAVGARNF